MYLALTYDHRLIDGKEAGFYCYGFATQVIEPVDTRAHRDG